MLSAFLERIWWFVFLRWKSFIFLLCSCLVLSELNKNHLSSSIKSNVFIHMPLGFPLQMKSCSSIWLVNNLSMQNVKIEIFINYFCNLLPSLVVDSFGKLLNEREQVLFYFANVVQTCSNISVLKYHFMTFKAFIPLFNKKKLVRYSELFANPNY